MHVCGRSRRLVDEEIYTIYPDGVAVREVILWPGTQSNHGGNANLWQVAEWILINAAGTSPHNCLELPTPFTLRNGAGEVIHNDRAGGRYPVRGVLLAN